MSDSEHQSDSTGYGRLFRFVLLFAVAVSAVVVVVLNWSAFVGVVSSTSRFLKAQGWMGALGFVGLGTAWMASLLPASVIFLACGAVWGLSAGTAMAVAANFLAGIVSFALARFVLAKKLDESKFGSRHFAVIRRAVQKEGFRGALLLRFSALPLSVINYGLGLSGLQWKHYLLASFAVVPNTWAFVAAGHAAGGLAGGNSSRGLGDWILLAVGIGATVLVMGLLGRRAKKMLAEPLAELEANPRSSK